MKIDEGKIKEILMGKGLSSRRSKDLAKEIANGDITIEEVEEKDIAEVVSRREEG